MSTEPKYPKRRFNARYRREMEAPDGWYLLPAGAWLTEEDLSWSPGEPEWVPESWLEDDAIPDVHAWTYARRLPAGQMNDDGDDSIIADTLAPDSYVPASDYWESAIAAEMARAKRKFPNWPSDPIHAAAIVMEEAGELVRAANEACYEPHKTDPARPLDAVITEAIQLGAMVRRFLESAGHYVVAPGPQHNQSD